jgi:hypothetical protein
MSDPLTDSLDEILAENYLGIGAIGSHVIASAWDDYANDRFDLTDLSTTDSELVSALTRLTTSIIEGGYLHSMRTPIGWVQLADYDEPVTA